MAKTGSLLIFFCVTVTISIQNPISEENASSFSFETLEIPEDNSPPFRRSKMTTEEDSSENQQNHMTILGFIEKVLNTAQHQSEMAVRRAKKRAELSRAIQEDAEKLIREAEEAKERIEMARRNRIHKRTKRVDSLEDGI